MPVDRFMSDPRDRARSIAATVIVHLVLGTALLTGLALHPGRRAEDSLKTFDVAPAPPPPVAAEPSPTPRTKERAAPEGREAQATPVVAPPARLPTVQPIAAAPVAGSAASPDAGAAFSGVGTGAGGLGSRGGRGGDGRGEIGTGARLISGNRGRLPGRLLRPFAADRGYADLLLTVGESGRVTGCSILTSSGSSAVDDAFCNVMLGQSRWSPALDTAGRPIAVQLRYTSTWSK